MIENIGNYLGENELVALFICLALGEIVGNIKIGKRFSFGSTIGTLFIALLIGQFAAFSVSATLQYLSIYMVIFIIGYGSAPTLLSGIKEIGLKIVVLAIFFVITGAVIAVCMGKLFSLGSAMTAGVYSGSLTQSTALLAAQEILDRIYPEIAIAEQQKGDASIAYAVGYFLSLPFMSAFIQTAEKKLLKADFIEEAKKVMATRRGENRGGDCIRDDETGDGMAIFPWALTSAIAVMIGTVHFRIFSFTWSISGVIGILFAGMICGAIHFKKPSYCHISSGCRWFMMFVGFNLFVACLGLNSARNLTVAIQQMGGQMVVTATVIAVGTYTISALFGRYVLHLNSIDVVGTQLGAGTYAVGLNAMTEYTGTDAFNHSYAISFIIGNTLITIFAPVIVYLMQL